MLFAGLGRIRLFAVLGSLLVRSEPATEEDISGREEDNGEGHSKPDGTRDLVRFGSAGMQDHEGVD